MKGCVIYGGSFNPVHIGHLRLAMEVIWHLGDLVSCLEFVPTARHPQKDSSQLLPLELRIDMIRECIKDQRNMRCNDLEGKRTAVSYTVDTIKEYLRKWDFGNIYFLLGSQDYALFDSWREWRVIARLCNLLVVPRGVFSPLNFEEVTLRFWPEARNAAVPGEMAIKNPDIRRMLVSENTFVYYLPVPWLPISSSWIRGLWLEKRNPLWLMPSEALEILLRNCETVNKCWVMPEYKG